MALRAHSAEGNNIESRSTTCHIRKRPARKLHAPAGSELTLARSDYCCVGWIGSIGAPPSFSKAFIDKLHAALFVCLETLTFTIWPSFR
jgi:hypothetical protein